MKILALSPGSTEQQLQRLPALWKVASRLRASIQIACPPPTTSVWELLPEIKKVIPFSFNSSNTLADWTNLLGNIREQDFQVCLNFAEGTIVNLMLSMCHIPKRISAEGFAKTESTVKVRGWSAQKFEEYLIPMGISLDANSYRLYIPNQKLEEVKTSQMDGDGPQILFAPNWGHNCDLSLETWDSIQKAIRTRILNFQGNFIYNSTSFIDKAAKVSCADLVITSCPIIQLLATYAGTPLIAIGASKDSLPLSNRIKCLNINGEEIAEICKFEVPNILGI